MLQLDDIQIRDPFVLPVAETQRYYLFGTTDKDCWGDSGTGFDCYVSSDLAQWEGPRPAFRPPMGFWGTRHFWAPEVHVYRGRYYMFASFKGDGHSRGTQVLVADAPQGPYAAHSDGAVTPSDWECLDGTLHVDASGHPWMVFCHEWTQIRDGAICALRLSDDLHEPVGEPITLFHGSDAPWAVGFPEDPKRRVTDGPFLHRTSGGRLLMLWSSFGRGGYAMGLAISETGAVEGPWTQLREPLVSNDGGHGMLFRDFEGRLLLTYHFPNKTPEERPRFVAVRETEDGLLELEAST